MKKADIIIFGGQSNMQGQTECLSDASCVENAFEYKFLTDTLEPLKNPVGENIRTDATQGYPPFSGGISLSDWLAEHALGAACYGNTNLVPSFCRAFTAKTGNTSIAVHTAKGSTTVAQWLCGTDGYRVLVKKAKAAIEKTKKSFDISGIYFVWLQGESDAIEGNGKEYYKEKLCELNESLKKDLSINRFGIIRVGRFVCDERDERIMEAQSEICRENGDFLMLTEETYAMYDMPQYMNPEAGGHFSAKGLERIGELSGEALGKGVL